VVWWSAEPDRVSRPAAAVLASADELAVSAITWFELAWLGHHGHVSLPMPVPRWLGELGEHLRTVGITPAIADTAVALPTAFPGDPADRLICATAIEHGWALVSKDRRLRARRHGGLRVVW
jgi:PIN domain nuclease of toxin-antitoxin system